MIFNQKRDFCLKGGKYGNCTADIGNRNCLAIGRLCTLAFYRMYCRVAYCNKRAFRQIKKKNKIEKISDLNSACSTCDIHVFNHLVYLPIYLLIIPDR